MRQASVWACGLWKCPTYVWIWPQDPFPSFPPDAKKTIAVDNLSSVQMRKRRLFVIKSSCYRSASRNHLMKDDWRPEFRDRATKPQMRPFPSRVAFALQFPISTHSPPSQWIVHSESSADETWDKFPKMTFERRSALQFLIQALPNPSWWIELLSQTRGKHGKNFTKELWNGKHMLQFTNPFLQINVF